MIYILGEQGNLHYAQRELALLALLRKNNVDVKLILDKPVYDWEAFQKAGIPKENLSTIYHFLCKQEQNIAKPYGIIDCEPDEDLALSKVLGNEFYYVNDLGEKQAKFVNTGKHKHLPQQLEYTENDQTIQLNFDSQGFVFSKTTVLPDKEEQVDFFSNKNEIVLQAKYHNHWFREINVLAEGVTFTEEDQFIAYAYDQMIQQSDSDDIFLLLNGKKAHRYLQKNQKVAQQVYLVPNFSVEEWEAVGIRIETFKYSEYAGMILESEGECQQYQQFQTNFGYKDSTKLFATNIFWTEDEPGEYLENSEKKYYLNLGDYGDQAEFDQLIRQLVQLAKTTNSKLIVEVYGIKRFVKLKAALDAAEEPDLIQLVIKQYQNNFNLLLKESRGYITLETRHQDDKIMKAISHELPILLTKEYVNANGRIYNNKTGIIFAPENLVEAIQTLDATFLDYLENKSLLTKQRDYFNEDHTFQRWEEIIDG